MTSALVFRFMQIFCAASMFEVQCNQFGAANSSHWLEELQDTGCAAACQHSHPNIVSYTTVFSSRSIHQSINMSSLARRISKSVSRNAPTCVNAS